MPKILGVNLYDYDIKTAVTNLIEDIKTSNLKQNKLISATGVHGMVTAQRSTEFKNVLENFYCNLPDGMPGVWLGRLKGAKKMKRCSGPSFFESLLRQSANEPIKHFFCGGKDGVADELKGTCEKRFSNHNIVGTFSPPFREMSNQEIKQLGQIVTDSKADVIWIGLSSPKQEKFAYRLREYTSVNYIITVGAAFDFHTNRLKKAPNWMQTTGFEWLFRLLMEPKRLYKRYFSIIPLFFYYNIRALIISLKTKLIQMKALNKLKRGSYWILGLDLKNYEYSNSHPNEFILGDLIEPLFVADVLDEPFDEVYELASDVSEHNIL